eukprot:TCONS_00064415-protein
MDEEDESDDEGNENFDPFIDLRTITEPEPLAPGLNISLQNSLLLHLTFAKRHNLTKAALKDLLHLTSLHLIRPNKFPSNLANMYSSIGLSEVGVAKKFYCKNCYGILNEADTQCSNCQFVGKDFFIFNDIEEQLRKQFQKSSFKDNLFQPPARVHNKDDAIRDIYDGKFYKKLVNEGYFENDGINLTCQLNSDGVSLFKSSTYSVWPVYLRINELPPYMRNCKEFKLLPCLWFGKQKPYMRTFLRPLVDAMKTLFHSGIIIRFADGTKVNVRMVISGGLFDLPAKCLAQEMVQFNGYFGCSFCEIKGEQATSNGKKKGSKTVFPLNKDCIPKLRQEDRTIVQAILALGRNKTIFGIKGCSILAELPYLNIIWNFPFDYMHGVFLGVSKTLANLWFDSSNSKNPWYLGGMSNIVENRLVAIKPPDEITRLPRSIINHRGYYKANEYRNWLFFYAPIILQDVLPEPYYSHFLLLSNAMFILQEEELPPTKIR